MKFAKIYILFFLGLLFPLLLLSQSTRQDLERKKRKTQEDINYTNSLLKKTQANQKESYNNLLLINSNITSRMELIESINSEISIVNSRIAESEFVVSMLQNDLDKLKLNYANMLRIAWKNHNKDNVLMFLLSSEDFNQSFLRLKYMQRLAAHRKRQLTVIQSIQAVLESEIAKLNKDKQAKAELLHEEKAEEVNLRSERRKQEITLSQLTKEEKSLRTRLQEHSRQAAQIQLEIEKLIREEAKRSSKGTSKVDYTLTPTEKIISTNFENNKSRLPWPVERGVIVSYYGKQNHPILSHVEIDNKGIDISTTTGTNARVVFDGEVRKIFQVPGSHYAVIIRHGEYLSVYTHLESVVVNVGDNVITKQIIGKIYTDQSENKTILHFEIWKASSVQNPLLWLSK